MVQNNDMNAQTTLEKNEIFKNSLLNKTMFDDLGYAHDGNFPSTTNDNYILKFNNPNNRKIEIKLRKGKIFAVIVSRDTDDDPGLNYEGGFYSFLLSDWLREAKQPNNPYPFFIKSFSGTFEEQVEGFLTFLENAFNHPTLLGTIQGSEWGYFPFNWGTHK